MKEEQERQQKRREDRVKGKGQMRGRGRGGEELWLIVEMEGKMWACMRKWRERLTRREKIEINEKGM